jgi:transcriptional regulator with XRE-family HTH domain
VDHFAKNLEFLRKKAGIKQDEAAAALGYKNRSRLANYEGGHSLPSMEDLVKLAEYYKVSLDDLVQGDLSNGVTKQQNGNVVEEPNEVYNTMYLQSLETKIKSLEQLNKILSTNNAELTTNNEQLLELLKQRRETPVKSRAPTKKNRG